MHEVADNYPVELNEILRQLVAYYGSQAWWPADDAFEVIIGAILTQSTSWSNVEKAIIQLRNKQLLTPTAIQSVSLPELQQAITAAGFYRRKSICIKAITVWLGKRGGIKNIRSQSTEEIRLELIELPGIGPETADAILLYAFGKTAFVIDKYTRRILSRLGMPVFELSYHKLQQYIEQKVNKDLYIYQEFHALLVTHAKVHCRKVPICDACPLEPCCSFTNT